MAAPKLRFHDEQGREYPEWETKKIGDYFKVKDIKTIESKETPLMAFVANKGIAPKGKRYDRSALVKTANKQYKRTDYGDFIYSSNNLDVGSIGLNLYGTAAISPVYEIFESKMKMNLQCINTLIQRPKNLYNVLRFRQGVIYGQLRIHPDDFLKVTCSFPSLPEQEKISNFLTTVDRQIDIQSQRVEAMRTRKKGLLQKIFSREIRFKDDQGKDYPAWKEIKLRSIVHRVTRKNRNLITKRPLTISAELGLIDQEEFFSKKIASDNLSNYYLLHKGEFAFNRSSATGYPFGAIKRLNRYESGAISTLYICFSVDNSDYSDWLQHFFESTYWHKEAYKVCCEGARNHGLLNISVDDFFSMKLYLPTLPEQQKIADFLTAVDKQIEVEEKRLETMKIIKKGLLQQMFI